MLLLKRTITAELAGALTLAALAQFAFIALGYVTTGPAGVISSNLRPYCALILLLTTALLAATQRYARAGLFAVAALAVFVQLGASFYMHRADWAAALQKTGGRELTVVNFNVYDGNEEDSARVASALAEQQADILILTEATHLAEQMPSLRQRYPHAAGCIDLAYASCDTIILSVHPLSDSAIRTLGPISINRFVSARVTVGSEAITVVAAHLVKPYFDNHDWKEIWSLVEYVNELPGPLLLAGDFNAAPWSSGIGVLLKHTELLAAPFAVATWPSAAGKLGVPIDHVFTRPPVVLARLAALPDNLGSNHRGVVAKVRY